MRILLINDSAVPTSGAAHQMLILRDGLRKRGHDARLFSSSAERATGDGLADYECFGTTSRLQTLINLANPWAFWRLRRVLADFQPDVVHVRVFLWQLSPLILPLLRDVPSLYQVMEYKQICPLGTKVLPDGAICQVAAGAVCYHRRCLPLRTWLPMILQMRLWRRWRDAFNLIVAGSGAVKRRLLVEGIQVAAVIGNAVLIQPSRPPLSAPPTVAFGGRLVREKGVDVLLRAFARVVAQIPEAQLLIAGDGPEREHLSRLIADLKLSTTVSMTGVLPRPELERRIAAAWVQAVPSCWEEPFNNAATEAMIRGTAVVASVSGNLSDIVQDGQSGILVPPRNADALAEALLRLLRDRELAERMGGVGREIALARFGEADLLERFVQLYQRLWQNRADISSYDRLWAPKSGLNSVRRCDAEQPRD